MKSILIFFFSQSVEITPASQTSSSSQPRPTRRKSSEENHQKSVEKERQKQLVKHLKRIEEERQKRVELERQKRAEEEKQWSQAEKARHEHINEAYVFVDIHQVQEEEHIEEEHQPVVDNNQAQEVEVINDGITILHYSHE